MRKFEISTDSTCDLYYNEIKELDITVGHLEYTISEGNNVEVYKDDFKEEKDYYAFYKRLKNGAIAKTSILNEQAHIDLFLEEAKKGVKNLLHISQGYGLSPTVDNANKAIQEVKKDFPDINYIAIECNTTTIGEGIIVRVACEMRDKGYSLEETVKKLNSIKGFTQHFVLVNDLKFLARGGRISKMSAGVGSLLQVKPIIEFGKDGKLKVCRKEIGLKKALNSIVRDYSLCSMNKEFPYIYIVHTDNLPLAKQLQSLLEEKYNIKPEIRIMGPIIGAHVGPGAAAYCFLSNEERLYD